MPYNRRPPAESEASAASVLAPFQPGVPADADVKDYADKPLPGDEDAPERVRIGDLSTKEVQAAADRDEPPAKAPKRTPSVSSLVGRSMADGYEGATMQPPRDLARIAADKKAADKKAADAKAADRKAEDKKAEDKKAEDKKAADAKAADAKAAAKPKPTAGKAS